MNKTIKQHYVPQFYLKNFSNLNKKTYYVNCFDKITKNNYQSTVSNVGMGKNFYTYEGGILKIIFVNLNLKLVKL